MSLDRSSKVKLAAAGGILAVAAAAVAVYLTSDGPAPDAAVTAHEAAIHAAIQKAEEEQFFDDAEDYGEPEEPTLKPARTPIAVDPDAEDEGDDVPLAPGPG